MLKAICENLVAKINFKRRTSGEMLQITIANEIRRRKLSWTDHTLRKPSAEPCRQALEWNPQGSRQRGRPNKNL